MSALTRRGLPPDLQYVIDGACDVHEIMGHHHYALWNYGDADKIDTIFNAPSRDGNYRRGRAAGCLGLIRYADEIIASMDDVERQAMAVFAFNGSRRIVAENAEFLAGWNFEDTIKGGCAIPFRRVYRGTEDGLPFPKADRYLNAPGAIRRYVKLYSDWDWLKAVVAGVKLMEPPRSLALPDAFLRREEEMRAARVAAQREAHARFEAEHGVKRKPVPYKVVKQRQSVVKRAAVMAAAVLGASTVSAFARGEPVRVQGHEIVFEFRASGNLHHLGHGGVDVSLLSKGGERLSNLCVYHADTPALDQLTAFALRISAGDEREIIRTGNLFGIQAAAIEHPALAERAKARAEAAVIGLPRRFRRDEAFKLRQAAYYARHRDLYQRAVAEVLFGRMAHHFVGGADMTAEARG